MSKVRCDGCGIFGDTYIGVNYPGVSHKMCDAKGTWRKTEPLEPKTPNGDQCDYDWCKSRETTLVNDGHGKWKRYCSLHFDKEIGSSTDPINRPAHYTAHPSGVECITITEAFNFNLGNAIKYIWRAGLKGDRSEDLKKAAWYVNREIERRAGEPQPGEPQRYTGPGRVKGDSKCETCGEPALDGHRECVTCAAI